MLKILVFSWKTSECLTADTFPQARINVLGFLKVAACRVIRENTTNLH